MTFTATVDNPTFNNPWNNLINIIEHAHTDFWEMSDSIKLMVINQYLDPFKASIDFESRPEVVVHFKSENHYNLFMLKYS